MPNGLAVRNDRGSTILICGASARAAAFSAIRAGLRPIAADLFADADLQACCQTMVVHDYPRGFGELLRACEYDRWMITGAIENYPALLESWVARFPGYCGCTPDAVRAVRSNHWREILAQSGISLPRRRWTYPPIASQPRWLQKPLRTAGGMHIVEASRASPRSNVLYEEFVAGTPLSGVFVASEKRCVLLGVSKQLIGRKWGGAGEFTFVGAVGPLDITRFGGSQWNAIGTLLARYCGLRGVFGLDAVMRKGTLWPIEVNPRFPSSAENFERYWPELSVVDLHIRSCRELIEEAETLRRTPDRPVQAKAIVWAPHQIEIPSAVTENWLHLTANEPTSIADVPRPGIIEKGRPVLTVFASGADADAATKNLRKSIAAKQDELSKLASR